jgi:hypothetical protein
MKRKQKVLPDLLLLCVKNKRKLFQDQELYYHAKTVNNQEGNQVGNLVIDNI